VKGNLNIANDHSRLFKRFGLTQLNVLTIYFKLEDNFADNSFFI